MVENGRAFDYLGDETYLSVLLAFLLAEGKPVHKSLEDLLDVAKEP